MHTGVRERPGAYVYAGSGTCVGRPVRTLPDFHDSHEIGDSDDSRYAYDSHETYDSHLDNSVQMR